MQRGMDKIRSARGSIFEQFVRHLFGYPNDEVYDSGVRILFGLGILLVVGRLDRFGSIGYPYDVIWVGQFPDLWSTVQAEES